MLPERRLYARVRIGPPQPLNPPACAAFPGGAFVRAMVGELEGVSAVFEAMDGRRPRRGWYDGVHKGPNGHTRRAPGNLPKRLRKAARKAVW